MLRWLGILSVLALLTGLMTAGIIPSLAIGTARILFGVYIVMLGGSLVVAILRG